MDEKTNSLVILGQRVEYGATKDSINDLCFYLAEFATAGMCSEDELKEAIMMLRQWADRLEHIEDI